MTKSEWVALAWEKAMMLYHSDAYAGERESVLGELYDQQAQSIREECAKIAETETEMPGPIPSEVREGLERLGMEEAHRMTCRITKENIARRIREGTEKRNCPSTYTHSSLGRLACEKDEAHLRRIGDVEHRRGPTIWMSL